MPEIHGTAGKGVRGPPLALPRLYIRLTSPSELLVLSAVPSDASVTCFSDVAFSPHGRLHFATAANAGIWSDVDAARRIHRALDESNAAALLLLATKELDAVLPPAANWWRLFARTYLGQLCHTPNLDQTRDLPPFPAPEPTALEALALGAPPMLGGEFLDASRLALLWAELDSHVRTSVAAHPENAAAWLQEANPLWRTVGRVAFHLAENKANPALPFAFLASYASRLSAHGRVQYQPLGRALQEFAGVQNKAGLLNLLSPVQKAAVSSALIRGLVDSGRIYKPLPWAVSEAHAFLKDVPQIEAAGIIVRLPDWWRGKGPSRAQVSVTIGNERFTRFGAETLLDFSVKTTLDGEELTPDELRSLLSATEGLVFVRGRWIEADAEQLKSALTHWKNVEKQSANEGLTFLEGLRLLSGFSDTSSHADKSGAPQGETSHKWTGLEPGQWLKTVLDQLRDPSRLEALKAIKGLNAELRPYQRTGLQWLNFVTGLGLGGCLADDMGLGKTLQVLALLLHRRNEATARTTRPPSLLVVPASLLGNWRAEISRFAPSLRTILLHPSECPLAPFVNGDDNAFKDIDFVVTTYGIITRSEPLRKRLWDLVVLDEAQAIKNGATRQTKAVKELRASSRLALTGTPVENRASDLWSLFDFTNPGLLGSASSFNHYIKRCDAAEQPDYSALRKLTRPYVLRRLKTDKRIISDLPEKTELAAWCGLSNVQAALYAKSVKELAEGLESAEGIQRKGLILAFLLRFKQICNHPSHWLKDDLFAPEASGKFARLQELTEEIAARQEKVLVFTQFREMTDPLSEFLETIFARPGLILHGGTAIPKRRQMVEAFQKDDGPPFFVLTVKAGGAGLNLTQAAHVLHFDRWWNPAVENQATDRAFRIGQRKNVLVHKFICRGTVEEKINTLIEEKKSLSHELLEGGGGAERLLSEMTNDELLGFVSLDLDRATAT